jgi:hypothetical protein
VLFSFFITLPSRHIFSQPYINSILDARNIDVLFDVLLNLRQNEVRLLPLLISAGFAVLAWIPVQFTHIWLEGGSFFSYKSSKPIGWKTYLKVCYQWFGFILLLRSISAAISVGILIFTIVCGIIFRVIWTPLLWCVFYTGLMIIVCLMMWGDIVCAAAIARDVRNIGRLLRYSQKIVKNESLSILFFIGISLIIMAAFYFLQRWFAIVLPVSWWIPSFIIFQGLVFARHGGRLLRYSGFVCLAQGVSNPSFNNSTCNKKMVNAYQRPGNCI